MSKLTSAKNQRDELQDGKAAFWKFSLFHAFPLNAQEAEVGAVITAIAWDVGELVVHCYLKD